jgi:hypothetical protein
MKLTDILLLSLSAALVIVGTHQTIVGGIAFSYPIFMLAVALLFWYKYRKNNATQSDTDKPVKPIQTKTKKRN